MEIPYIVENKRAFCFINSEEFDVKDERLCFITITKNQNDINITFDEFVNLIFKGWKIESEKIKFAKPDNEPYEWRDHLNVKVVFEARTVNSDKKGRGKIRTLIAMNFLGNDIINEMQSID